MTMIGSSRHAGPVEEVLVFPSGTMALSASGAILRTWDLVAGGRCLRAMSNHQKTITSLAFNSGATRLLTGGLDQMVKVYDTSTYKVVHTMRYPAPVLCLAISVSFPHPTSPKADKQSARRNSRCRWYVRRDAFRPTPAAKGIGGRCCRLYGLDRSAKSGHVRVLPRWRCQPHRSGHHSLAGEVKSRRRRERVPCRAEAQAPAARVRQASERLQVLSRVGLGVAKGETSSVRAVLYADGVSSKYPRPRHSRWSRSSSTATDCE
jgi:WD40 repeat protein